MLIFLISMIFYSWKSEEIIRISGSDNQTRRKYEKMTFKLIPEGNFKMGSPTTEIGRGSDAPQHCRSAIRLKSSPDFRYYFFGFRLVRMT